MIKHSESQRWLPSPKIKQSLGCKFLSTLVCGRRFVRQLLLLLFHFSIVLFSQYSFVLLVFIGWKLKWQSSNIGLISATFLPFVNVAFLVSIVYYSNNWLQLKDQTKKPRSSWNLILRILKSCRWLYRVYSGDKSCAGATDKPCLEPIK